MTAQALPWSNGAAYIDGAFCPIEEAKISVLDMGLTRSDCTYDVVHVWKGRFFRLDKHIQRFMASVKSLRLDLGFGPDELTDILHGVVSRGGLRDSYVSMTCTRGRPAPGSRDLARVATASTASQNPFVWISSPEQQATGTHMWISDMPRIPPESVDPAVKNYHWLDLDMALLDAYDRDAQMVVLRDLSGAITEGAGYNVFAFVDGRWLTPNSGSQGHSTRRTVIELCRESNVDVEEGRSSRRRPASPDEVIVTSTAGGIMPVTRLEGRSIGEDDPAHAPSPPDALLGRPRSRAMVDSGSVRRT